MKKQRKDFKCFVDAGNTNIKISVFYNSEKKIDRFSELSKAICYLNSFEKNFDLALLSSVRDPKSTQALFKVLNKKACIVHKARDLAKPLFNSSYSLDLLGEDRLCALAYASYKNHAPCAIINAGTAITLDFLMHPNHFMGGYILSGFQTEWNALFLNTALLPPFPSIPLRKSLHLPQSTHEAISQGIFQIKNRGISSLINYVFSQFKTVSKPWTVLLSGGDAELLKHLRDDRNNTFMIPELVTKGLITLAKHLPRQK